MELKVDTDRNGEIDANDAAGKDEWKKERGAIYQVNFDRDGNNSHNGKPAPDAVLWWSRNDQPDFEDWTIQNDEDGQDLAPLRITPFTGIGEDAKVYLSVPEEEDYRAIHLFPSRKGGTEAIWGGILTAGRPWTDGDANPLDIEITNFKCQEESFCLRDVGVAFYQPHLRLQIMSAALILASGIPLYHAVPGNGRTSSPSPPDLPPRC